MFIPVSASSRISDTEAPESNMMSSSLSPIVPIIVHASLFKAAMTMGLCGLNNFTGWLLPADSSLNFTSFLALFHIFCTDLQVQ